MSDTPRTDAAVRDVDVAFVGHWGLSSEPQEFVSPEFTRELERENAALRRDVYQCPPTSENSYEGFKWCDAVDEMERENAELHNEVTALKRENLSLREARKPVAVPGLHGLVTWYADAQQLGEAFQREREKCIRFEEVMQSQGDEIRRLTAENDALHKTLNAAIDAARAKEGQP